MIQTNLIFQYILKKQKINQKRDDETYVAQKKNLFTAVFELLSKFFFIVNLIWCVYQYNISNVSDLLLISSNYDALSSLLEGLLTDIVSFIIADSSFTRLQNLLYEDIHPNQEQKRSQLSPSNISPDQSILIENLNFSYPQNSNHKNETVSEQKKFILSIDNFSVKQGEIVAVIGGTGSGKSMLLQSLLGETEITDKDSNNNQSSFYISTKNIGLSTQTAWVMKGSIKENIIFGNERSFDHERYDQVLKQTQIYFDLENLPNKDLTQVSEKGESLSGGQKRRINLARTIYRGGDIFLLDDILTGLDSQVSRLVMSECLNGPLMKKSTRILFQSSFKYLNNVDRIYVLNEGNIIKSGTFEQISSSNIYKEIQQQQLDNFNEEQSFDLNQEDEDQQQNKNNDNQNTNQNRIAMQNNVSTQNILQNQEDQKEGVIESWVYKRVYELFGGRNTAFLFIMLGLVSTYFEMAQFQVLGQPEQENQQVNKEENSKMNNDENTNEFKGIMIKYITFLIVGESFDVLKTFLFCFKNFQFCRKFHSLISQNLLNASYSQFYSKYSTGVLSNRLSNDLMEVDIKIYELLNPILSIAFGCLGVFFVFISLQQISLYAINITAIIVWVYVTKLYLKVQRECTRIQTVSKSPLLNYFSEIYRGSQYIKQCVDPQIPINEINNIIQCQQEFQQYVKTNIRNQIIEKSVTKFYTIVIFTILIVFEVSLFITMVNIFSQNLFKLIIFSQFYDHSVTGEQVSVVLVTAINMGLLVMSALQVWSIFESHAGIHIERCCKLAYQVPIEEGSPILYNSKNDSQKQISNDQYEMSIINQGSIEASSASFGIRNSDIELVKNFTFTINNGEKIGLVGRTGAGKTSLTNGLISLLDLTGGDVLINRKSIQGFQVKDLRNHFSVIPQEPFIFEGTLRENIDPNFRFSDQQILDIYNELSLSNYLSFKSGLNSEIHIKGGNLSVGEKQLISITRCLLKNSPIVLIDEVTSCLDEQTEKLITDVILNQLKNKTILTVAHKLNTVLHSDKIFVINQGQLIEQGQPAQLLQLKENSIFFKMLKRFIK